MSKLVSGINTPIGTPSPSPTLSPERNSRGCLLKCPQCGESLVSANASQSPVPAASNSALPSTSSSQVPPVNKGLFGLGFLGLGGRRRGTMSRRRRRQTRRGCSMRRRR